MTRKKEINQASQEFACSVASIRPELNADSFRKGAERADKTMIEKAVEWLKEEFYITEDIYGNPELVSSSCNNVEELIEDFKKAMEE